MVDFKIRVKNPEESRGVQGELFKRGYKWEGGEKVPSYLEETFLYIEDGLIDYGDTEVMFKDDPLQEITVKQLLGGKKMKPKKPTHIVVWEEDEDPTKLCYSFEEVRGFVENLLLREPDVIEDSIRIYEIKAIIIPKLNITFKKA